MLRFRTFYQIRPSARLSAGSLDAPLDTDFGRSSCDRISPVLGSGVPLSFMDRVFLGGPRDSAGLVEHGLSAASGGQLMKGGKAIDDPRTVRAVLEDRVAYFLGRTLPFLRQLGIAD